MREDCLHETRKKTRAAITLQRGSNIPRRFYKYSSRIYEFAAQLLSQLARITLFVHYQKPFDRIVIEIPSRCHSFRKIQLRECNKRPRCKRNVGVDCAVFARETPERRKIRIRVTTLVSVAASCHAHGNFHLYQ